MDRQHYMFHCKSCNWRGKASLLEWDIVETCMGSDRTEMCPICGSLDVKQISETIAYQNNNTCQTKLTK
jgi:hypothetical protein